MTLPFTNAILKFSNCGTAGSSNTPVEMYSSCVLNAPMSTTTNGIITIRQQITRKMYFNACCITRPLRYISSRAPVFFFSLLLMRYFSSLKNAFCIAVTISIIASSTIAIADARPTF